VLTLWLPNFPLGEAPHGAMIDPDSLENRERKYVRLQHQGGVVCGW